MTTRPFLHGIDMQTGQASLLWTSAQRLRKAAFVDGRSLLSRRPPALMALRTFLDRETEPAPPPRYIFHVGFCGSTLLSRLLDVTGQALVLREPNALADIANAKAQLAIQDRSNPELAQVVAAASRHLARPWADGEAVVVKPSNWANNILPMLMSQSGVKAVMMTSSRRAFLEAVLRGGADRLAFSARAAIHLSSEGKEHALLVAAALQADEDQSGQLARLALVLHAIQLRQLGTTAKQAEWDESHWLDYTHLVDDPLGAVRHAADILHLDIATTTIEANISRWMTRDAKDPQAPFPEHRNAQLAAAARAEYGSTMEQALNWAERFIAD